MSKQAQKSLLSIEKRISAIKQALLRVGEMRPGSLSKQTRAGKGAYYHLSYTHRMQGHTEYVRAESASEVRRQTETYRRFKRLVEEWVSLAIEHSKLKLSLSKDT